MHYPSTGPQADVAGAALSGPERATPVARLELSRGGRGIDHSAPWIAQTLRTSERRRDHRFLPWPAPGARRQLTLHGANHSRAKVPTRDPIRIYPDCSLLVGTLQKQPG